MYKIRINEILVIDAQDGVERVLFRGIYQVTEWGQGVDFIRDVV